MAERDYRIDFFRGFALYMIVVDHIAGDPLARLTYQHFGFSDAAEIFVFLSGLACGIAYSRSLARSGFNGFVLAVTKRAARIYLYYGVSSAVVIVAATLAATVWHIDLQGDGLAIQGDRLATEIRWMLLLRNTPAHSEVLVLYIALTLIVIPTFLLSGERNARFSLALSGLVWLFSPLLADLCGPPVADWYFNPFAWQFLFTIGMFFGVKWDCPQPQLQLLRQLPWLLPTCWTIVALAFAYKLLMFLSPPIGLDLSGMRIDQVHFSAMKRNLSTIRLCHFLSVAFIVATYVQPNNVFLRTRLALPITWCGKSPLQIFSLTIVISAFANIHVMAFHPGIPLRLVMDLLAFALMSLAACALLPGMIRKFRVVWQGSMEIQLNGKSPLSGKVPP